MRRPRDRPPGGRRRPVPAVPRRDGPARRRGHRGGRFPAWPAVAPPRGERLHPRAVSLPQRRGDGRLPHDPSQRLGRRRGPG